jgi:hypothetical protein
MTQVRPVKIDGMYIYLRNLYDIMLSNDRKTEKGKGNLDIVAGSNAMNDTEIFDTQRRSSLAACSDAVTG